MTTAKSLYFGQSGSAQGHRHRVHRSRKMRKKIREGDRRMLLRRKRGIELLKVSEKAYG